MSNNLTHLEKPAETLRTRQLPDRSPRGTWAGPGSGACCAICDEPISVHDVEFELEFAADDGVSPETYRAHRCCFLAWQDARREAALASGLSPAGVEAKFGADEREGSP